VESGYRATVKLQQIWHATREPTDYVEISRRLYEGQSIEEIFDRAKKERPSH
jgi:hypothetical protein